MISLLKITISYTVFLLFDGMISKEKIKQSIKTLPSKKAYLDFFTATLTIPILITAIVTNINNLKTNPAKTNAPQPSQQITVVTPTPFIHEAQAVSYESVPVAAHKSTDAISPTLTPALTQTSCKKMVGPARITYPGEMQTVSTNPVCFDIAYQSGEYCDVVWSYRINGGSWSDFTDKPACLYNLSSGTQSLEIKVRSISSSDEVILDRNFVYTSGSAGNITPTISPTPISQTSTSSATLQ